MNTFSQNTLEFLFENRLNDSRDWFWEHHDQYEQWVLSPLRDLAQALAPTAAKIDPEIVLRPDRTISRIRRDTRFSHDKSLYRDNMWIIFKRGKAHGDEVPGLYFEINRSGFEYGCGFYHCSPAVMSAIRQMVLEDAPLYRKGMLQTTALPRSAGGKTSVAGTAQLISGSAKRRRAAIILRPAGPKRGRAFGFAGAVLSLLTRSLQKGSFIRR